MHYLLGLAALVMGTVIATRRTRPTWFVVLTSVLVGLGALLAILSYTRVTDPLGLLTNSIIGWVFVGLAIITMLSAVFVLERRGEHGEELPPLIGDNPFDGDTDDSDDPAPGTAAGPTSQDGVAGSDADVLPDITTITGSLPAVQPGAIATEAPLAAAPHPDAAASTTTTNSTEGIMTDSTTASGSHDDADEVGATPKPVDGTAVVGTDPDIATSDQDAAQRAEADDDRTN